MRILLTAAIALACITSAVAQFGTRLTNNSGSTIAQYDVVIIDTGTALSVETTTTAATTTVVGVANEQILNAASGTIVLPGSVTRMKVTGTIAIGDALVTSTSAGRARKATPTDVNEVAATCALAMEANASGDATIKVLLIAQKYTSGLSGYIANSGTVVDNRVVRFSGTTGTAVDQSTAVIDDSGNTSGIANLTMTGVLTAGSAPHTLTNAAGLVDGAKLQPATVTATQMANDAVTAAILSDVGSFTVADLTATAAVQGATLTSTGATNSASLLVGGGYGSTGATVAATGNIQTNGTLTVDSTSTLTGNVTATADVAASTVNVGGGYAGGTGATFSTAGVGQFNGALTTDGVLTGLSGAFGGGYGSTGATISSAGVGQFNGALTTDGLLTAASFNINGGGSLTRLVSAAYTPTLTDVANAGTMDLLVARYAAMGTIVDFSLTFRAAITTTATLTQVRITVPIASNFANLRQCSGAGATDDSLGGFIVPISVVADPTNDAILISFLPGTATSLYISLSGSYVII